MFEATDRRTAQLALDIRGLEVTTPDGTPLFRKLDLTVHTGELVGIIGSSGSGKTTLARVLFERDVLEDLGFNIKVEKLDQKARIGLVLQNGALFDYLDICGNIELAQKRGGGDRGQTPQAWLEQLELEPELATRGTSVTQLSGGQAQRVAVARSLAAGQKLIFFDEPGTGLDPHRVRVLGQVIRRQCDRDGTAGVVITHDVDFAVGVCDRILFLDSDTGQLVDLLDGTFPGPFDRDGERVGGQPEDRGVWVERIRSAAVVRIAKATSNTPAHAVHKHKAAHRFLKSFFMPFRVTGTSLAFSFSQAFRYPRDYLKIFGHVMHQAAVRPFAFYAVASLMLGFTVLYVFSRAAPEGVQPQIAMEMVGGKYVTALAPALSAILFAATSGNALNAWFGSMSLNRQLAALSALGIDPRRYLWAPSYLALGLSYLICLAVFWAGMTLGGMGLAQLYGINEPWALMTADLTDPLPERIPYVTRAVFLGWIYAWGLASDAIAKGCERKEKADDVTRGMTRSVIACTLWVVVLELVTVAIVFWTTR
jgi:ABC-type nitrate/sulfonate/bicarbonate transport system ATPase subunit/ABC-type transporter Mla maintaining outer membrane lipid asymmetry permease subunit MlaE